MSNRAAYKRIVVTPPHHDVEQTSSANEAYAILLEDERRESSIIQAMSIAEAVAEVERATANPEAHNAQVLRLVTKPDRPAIPLPSGRPARRRRQSFASMVEEQFAQSMMLQSEAIGLSSSIFRRPDSIKGPATPGVAPTRNERVNDPADEFDLVFRLDEGAVPPVVVDDNGKVEDETTSEVREEDIEAAQAEEEDTDKEIDELTVRRESPLAENDYGQQQEQQNDPHNAPTLPAPPMDCCSYHEQESVGANMGIPIAPESFFYPPPSMSFAAPQPEQDIGGGYGHLLLLAASITLFATALIFVALVRSGFLSPLG
jgi:hypothetical protein